MEQRQWTHQEMPEAKPSAAAARLGCKCGECATLYRDYMREYKRKKAHLRSYGDGTAFYHLHKGQPSKKTARAWGCAHPRCLHLAGLYLDQEGIVRNTDTDAVDPDFGKPTAA